MRWWIVRLISRGLVLGLAVFLCVACGGAEPLPGVTASAETEPVRSSGDAADDPAIWVHPVDPALSTVIGTDRRGGLGVYDLSGMEVQFMDDAPADNADVRTLVLSGSPQSLVVASGWDDRMLHVYVVDVPTRRLRPAGTVRTGVAAAGLCLYRNPASGRVYAFAMDEAGVVEQWELFEESGGIAGGLVRGPWSVGGETEGCVADDERGVLYVGEEDRGIWRYEAEHDRPSSERVLIDDVRRSDRLQPDVEGLAIASSPGGSGMLVVSSQGDSSFVVYRRDGINEIMGKFRVVPEPSASLGSGAPGGAGGPSGVPDGCEDTDGIDVVVTPLGPDFPNGLFVCQDGDNGDQPQNFKLVPLERVMDAVR